MNFQKYSATFFLSLNSNLYKVSNKSKFIIKLLLLNELISDWFWQMCRESILITDSAKFNKPQSCKTIADVFKSLRFHWFPFTLTKLFTRLVWHLRFATTTLILLGNLWGNCMTFTGSSFRVLLLMDRN